jgi:hypothetical protein
LLGGDRFVAEGEHFGARKNLQLGDFGNFGDDVFGDAVAKIFVFFGAALIFEIKDGDGLAFLLDRMRGGAGAGSAFFGGGPAAGFEVAAEALEVGAQYRKRTGSAGRDPFSRALPKIFSKAKGSAEFNSFAEAGTECRMPSKITAAVAPAKGKVPVAIS